MSISVQDVIHKLVEPVGSIEPTVDVLISGSPQAQVTGIVTAFMPSHNVLEQAMALGANLVIAHEGAYYSHQGDTQWLKNNSTYLAKKKFIEQSGLAIFRLHDYIHATRPDAITAGLVHALGWQSLIEESQPFSTTVNIPAMSVKALAEHIKNKLNIPSVRVVGSLSMPCARIGLLVGYRGGGRVAIPLFEDEQLDVIIAGEGPEWETPEYVRDALFQGKHKAFIMIGHAESEEPGMRALTEQLASDFPSIPVQFISEKPIFQII